MSARGSKIAVGLTAGAFAVLFATTAARSERARSTESVEAVATVVLPSEPDTAQHRRQRLNARMAEMLRSSEGARLTEPAARSRRSASADKAPRLPAQPGPIAATNALEGGAARAQETDHSTIAPPPFTGGIVRAAGRGYTPPRLDLTTPPKIPTSDVECLTQAIYYEARNESGEGQAAVAEVVMNRSRSGAYPRSICAVVYQRNSRTCQFTFTCDGAIGRSPVDMRKWARAERIAREVYEGKSTTLLPANSVNYHANYVRPSWGSRLERVRQIGAHIFYGAARGGGGPQRAARSTQQALAPTQSGLSFVRLEALDRAFEAAGGSGPADGQAR